MYICVCHGVTDLHIDQAVTEGASCMRDLRENLKVATQCGRCASCARDQLHSSLQQCAKSHARADARQQNNITPLTQKIAATASLTASDNLQLAGT
ncbi:(2Fe-2S)-binding protein [Pseudomaricurvus sp. HS19]|uniref:(2Fe-2S)-binding protein n=1 Tax=Pseudomaricurvus sp. HS19 TaxID=2692626 RepID=UPI00136C5138|nr:(2Fe-2S)-binding protein [Pseudomaricurvus sp. HS19]MYM62498.1 bacterioferritin [Pseudomaricurvus sp. HS19]